MSEKTIVKVAGGSVESAVESHRCSPPDPRRFIVGDVFVCGTCARRHKLRDAQSYLGGPYWGAA